MQLTSLVDTSFGPLHHRHWKPDEPALDSFLIIHGFGEHGLSYEAMATKLVELRYEVHCLDLLGHGLSSGARGYVPHLNAFWISQVEALHALKKHRNFKNSHVLAHSMGGLIAMTGLSQFKNPDGFFKSLTLSNPLVKEKLHVPGWKKSIGDILAQTLPKMSLPQKINFEHLSSIPIIQERLRNDELRHSKVSARLYKELSFYMAQLSPKTIDEIPLPIELWLSTEDKICDPEATLKLFKNSPTTQIHKFKNSEHEILNDIELQLALELLVKK